MLIKWKAKLQLVKAHRAVVHLRASCSVAPKSLLNHSKMELMMIVDLLMDVTPSRHRLAMEVSSVWSRSEAKYESRGGQLCGGEGGVDGKENVSNSLCSDYIFSLENQGPLFLWINLNKQLIIQRNRTFNLKFDFRSSTISRN